MKNVAILGAGHIGSAIYSLLKEGQYCHTTIFDKKINAKHVQMVDVMDPISLNEVCSKNDVIVSALPHNLNEMLIRTCVDQRKTYFDLTEDITSVRQLREYVEGKALPYDVKFIQQCGVAPGAVSIIAMDMIKSFNLVDSVDVYVGALPQFPTNQLKYNLTWSVDGLINEYLNPCEVLRDFKQTTIPALTAYELINIEGVEYEAAATSGGIGSLVSTLAHKKICRDVTYRTLRYPGHFDRINFLINDFNLPKNKKIFIDLIRKNISTTQQDVVVIMIKVKGVSLDGVLEEKVYHKKILSSDQFTAIQISTANGVCSMLYGYLTSKFDTMNPIITHESISLKDFYNNRYGEVYLN